MKSEKEINIIRYKLESNQATFNDTLEFLDYVGQLEKLVEEASDYDTFGTQGWKYAIGWEE